MLGELLATVQTGDKVNACCVCVHVAKCVALLSTACERVCLDVLTRIFYTYLYSNYIYMDYRLQSRATAEKQRLKIHIATTSDSKYI